MVRHAAWAFMAGGLAFLLLGNTPTRLPPPAAAAPGWMLPAIDAGASKVGWPAPVWASEPAPANLAPALAPQPRLLGIVRTGNRRLALFEMPDGKRVRAAEGERLPNNSEVTVVAPTHAAWRDAKGSEHMARLLDTRTN